MVRGDRFASRQATARVQSCLVVARGSHICILAIPANGAVNKRSLNDDESSMLRTGWHCPQP